MTNQPTPPGARRATPDDAPEILRLRDVMRLAMFGHVEEDPLTGAAVAKLRDLLAAADPRAVAFVVDAPDRPGLVSSAIGSVDERLPTHSNPRGRTGFVYGVATDEAYRRRGYSRQVMRALCDWYDEQGILRIELVASRFGEGLYRELGFTEPANGVALQRRRPPRH